jgi:hypothetical protein
VKQRLPFKPVPGLPKGVAALPAGLPQLQGLALPTWAKLGAASGTDPSSGVGHE